MDFKEVTFVTDDRDKSEEDRLSLRITQGGNGDWYLSIAPVNNVAINGVRICTSGGASSSHPGLTTAISDAYQAIYNAEHGIRDRLLSRQEMEDELAAWREKFPDHVFDGLMLQKKTVD
ncbi:hypothetical protein MUB04_14925 [Acinetobacter indicus]|uniref:hypothetical protein n=1 Tax=Acinetobacter TaxID=469 RepID=UPI0015D44495|nr:MULTISPECIES: hypothetical protein [Acinetobacter]MCP0917827.1 hypothetical protein [Acinetobacter indicus]